MPTIHQNARDDVSLSNLQGSEGPLSQDQASLIKVRAAMLETEKAVYIINKSSSEENNMLIVFTDKDSLKNTRIRHFVRDCRSIAVEASGLIAAVEREQMAVVDFLNRA